MTFREVIFPSLRIKTFPFLKRNEVWISVFLIDFFSAPLVVFSGNNKHVTPDRITMTSGFFFFIGVAMLFFVNIPTILISFVFFLSILLDGMDGQLARLRGRTSRQGALLDAAFDMVSHGIGLPLVGWALAAKFNNNYYFFVLLFYSIFLVKLHLGNILRIRSGKFSEKTARPDGPNKAWRDFCDQRGLIYFPYTDCETIFAIVCIGVSLDQPLGFLLFVICMRFSIHAWIMLTERYARAS